MVKLHIKKGDESQFLFETTVNITIDDLLVTVVSIYNGRLKVLRICTELEELSDHGITLPPNMQGLTEEQIMELKLVDEWKERCQPSGGSIVNKDDLGRRNGQAPTEKLAAVLRNTVKEAKDIISKRKVDADVCLTEADVSNAQQLLKGAVMIVYPMGLPPHDPIRQELENCEDLSGTQAALEVVELDNASLWWAGKEMIRGKKLCDFIGKNDKTKVVCKLQKKGMGAPSREPVVDENEKKAMMAYYYRRQEELKKLDEATDDSCLDSEWADSQSLKCHFQGLSNIQFRPGKKM